MQTKQNELVGWLNVVSHVWLSSAPATGSMSSVTFGSVLLLPLLLSSSFSTPVESGSIFFSSSSLLAQCRTLISLSHSLMNRVAQLRASRGDYSGSERARRIAEKLEGGRLGVWGGGGGIWSMSWDYIRNYAWREVSWMEMSRAVSDVNQLLNYLNELTRLESDRDRAAWVVRNYHHVLGLFNSLLGRLLKVFVKAGPLRELIVSLQREAEGGLLRDCLELGTNDLKGLIQIVKDIGLQFAATNANQYHQHSEL